MDYLFCGTQWAALKVHKLSYDQFPIIRGPFQKIKFKLMFKLVQY